MRIVLSVAMAFSPLAAGTAAAQDGPDVTFELRPHCVESNHAAADNQFGGEIPEIEGIVTLTDESSLPCPEFAVRDPLSRQTDVLKVGDVLDMDLVIHNPSGKALTGFRVWIAYDSNTLDGTSIDLTNVFPYPTPGETDFSVADNYVKIAAASDDPITDTKIVVARIVMNVVAAPSVGTALSFYDSSGSGTAHTGAFVDEVNAASQTQGSLAVRFGTNGSAASSAVVPVAVASSAPSVATSSAASVSSVPALPDPTIPSSSGSSSPAAVASSAASSVAMTTFSKLQVQSLRVTTEGSSVFLAWNPLPSSDIAGYNLYYGSISGKYLQRRSVEKEGQTITIRALPVGQTYYFAVRAVNVAGDESDFSQEVAVTVGNPATSTSPLSGALIEGGPNGNAPDTDGNVAGESGPGTWILAFVVASAVAGTMLAFRRQMTVPADNR